MRRSDHFFLLWKPTCDVDEWNNMIGKSPFGNQLGHNCPRCGIKIY